MKMQSELNPYDEQYYKTSNYADYLERADRYKKTAQELSQLLTSLGLLNYGSKIIDFGSGPGLLMEGFEELGYKNVSGYEISDWSIEQARLRGNDVKKFDISKYNKLGTKLDVDVLIALDVFEHMSDLDISMMLSCVNPKVMIVRIPCSTDGGKSFHLEVSRKDPTHINCKTKVEWINFLRDFEYNHCLKLNLLTIYDSPGVFCSLVI